MGGVRERGGGRGILGGRVVVGGWQFECSVFENSRIVFRNGFSGYFQSGNISKG